MEGIPTTEKNEGVPQGYRNQFAEYGMNLIERAKNKAHVAAAFSLLGLSTIGCQNTISISTFKPDPKGPNLQTMVYDAVVEGSDKVRDHKNEQNNTTYRFDHKVEGDFGAAIGSGGQKYAKGHHTDRERIYTKPGSMAREQEENRQKAIREDQEREKIINKPL